MSIGYIYLFISLSVFIASALQTELENLSLHLFYMTNAKEDIRSDIAVMRRAAEKADSEVATAEMDKQKQVCLKTEFKFIFNFSFPVEYKRTRRIVKAFVCGCM